MSEAEKGRPSYLDLLVAALMEHEKDLDRLVKRLEAASEKLSVKQEGNGLEDRKRIFDEDKNKDISTDPITLVYMKIKFGSQIEKIAEIIESLKE